MKAYVILFRGINVGGNNLLPMKELKSLLLDNDFHDVSTYIQSGNVVLRTNYVDGIAELVESNFGFKPKILAFEKSQYQKIVNVCPYQGFEGKTVHFYFCESEPKLDHEKMQTVIANGEEYKLIGNTFYLHAPNGIGRSKLVANIDEVLGTSCTGRNLNTVMKVKQLLVDIPS